MNRHGIESTVTEVITMTLPTNMTMVFPNAWKTQPAAWSLMFHPVEFIDATVGLVIVNPKEYEILKGMDKVFHEASQDENKKTGSFGLLFTADVCSTTSCPENTVFIIGEEDGKIAIRRGSPTVAKITFEETTKTG